MKYKIYALMSLLLLLVSCAEEGPFTVGKLEWKLETSSITPTTAIITLTIPKGTDNLLAQSTERPYISISTNSSSGISNGTNDKYYNVELLTADKAKGEYSYCVENLDPSTTYYVTIETRDILGDDIYTAYSPDYSFKTAPAGDYSGLGDITCEVIGLTETTTTVMVTLPPLLGTEYSTTLMASKSPEMTNALSVTGAYADRGQRELVFTFNNMEKTTYYFKLKGRFYILNSSTGDTITTLEEGLVIPITNSIDMARVSYPILAGEVFFSGTDYSIFKVTFPENLSASTNYSYLLSVSWTSDNTDVPNVLASVVSSNVRDCYIAVSQGFQQGETVKINLTGNFALTKYASNGHLENYFKNTFEVYVDIINPPVDGGLVNFELQRDKENNQIYLVAICNERFSFQYESGYSPQLYLYSSIDHLNYDSRLVSIYSANYSEDRIYYDFTSSGLSKLEEGNTYYLRFKSVNLIYNEINFYLDSSTNYFIWTYKGLPEGL